MEQHTDDVELPIGTSPGPAAYGSDLVVDLLRALGTRYVPLNPGSSFRGLHDSLVNHGGNRAPQLLLCLHEEIAVSLAHGYAKGSGQVGVAAVHDLVGLMHASMAVYDAFCDRVPVLVLGGSGPVDPAQRRPVDWTHSATTQAQLVRDFVSWDAEPATAAAFVSDTLRAHQRAASAPRGPAYVSLDAGVQEAPLDAPVPIPDLALHAPAPPPAADEASIARALDVLLAAQRPAVAAGNMSWDPAATAVLVELVERLGAGYHDDRHAVSFPSAHPLNGTGDRDWLTEADVVLAIGVPDVPGLLRRRGRSRASGAGEFPRVVDVSTGHLGLRSWSNVFETPLPRAAQLLADPLTGARQLLHALRDRGPVPGAEARRERVAARVAQQRAAAAEARQEGWAATPIKPARLVSELWDTVRDVPHLLCLRNSRSWPEGVWDLAGAGSYLGHSGGGGVGYGPGAFVGGALAARDRGLLGVGIIGDGDLLMAAGALWTAVHHRIPALLVVNDNGSFYNDEPHQAAVARDRGREPANSWIGMRIADPAVDIDALAASYGCWTAGTVTDPGELAGAFAAALAAAQDGRVAVVHVRTEPA
ncbi:thiamine pyrophosphate-binding protein [Modestobacter marinus]|uniref:Acetolactate synthase-1/2/3 large subunit n=1 Tax=Modestobacter marinus TaxID=477641 RepID=A0A846LP92_9ACTN|nr:thiamine pyrophosphate-binding protein [Modestobacter marinus]NIH67168.1 acetolactate synthase-1/2/3 large subunit [Modestobacter marinus]GGL52604.1 thiamine pyrophosphate-binding protein [Modestobacter marinus]